MVVQLLTTQIPIFWDAIKTAVIKADEVPEKDREEYLVEMLLDLLSDKAQCFVRQDKDLNIQSILVSRVTRNRVSGNLSVEIQCLYSFVTIQTNQWIDEFRVVKQFYAASNVKSIEFMSKNPRVWQLADQLGFQEASKRFVLEVK